MGWFGSTPSFASLNDVNRMKAEGDVESLLKILRDYNQVAQRKYYQNSKRAS